MSWGKWLRDFSRASPAGGWRLERAARWTTLLLILAVPAALLAGLLWTPGRSGRAIELVARQPSAGGWSEERIVVRQGERVRLRIRAEDVVHGFAIGRLGVDAGPIEPGKVTEVEFTADRPGEFTFYCNTWCDPNHPRMRGILEVREPGGATPPAQASAPDVALQHLDAPRAAAAVPPLLPSAVRGRALYEARCTTCHGADGGGTGRGPAVARRDVLHERTPAQVFGLLAVPAAGRPAGRVPAHTPFTRDWQDQDRWDVVAHLWRLGTSAEGLALGRRLYATNCAACHGEGGAGDGPGGKAQPKTPANFTDARRMLAGTTALYTAKVRRGGMGTGMPYWGSIFTEEELGAVVDYVWSFSLGTRD